MLTHSREFVNFPTIRINFNSEPVDATSVPENLKGIRTLFSAFHHFKPDSAKKILQDAVDKKAVIAIFEFTERKLSKMIRMMVFLPIIVLFQIPFIRPFKWSRLFWTYVIPVFLFTYFWDAIVSLLRTYSLEDLQNMVSEINCENYSYELNKLDSKKFGLSITYLIGYPTDGI